MPDSYSVMGGFLQRHAYQNVWCTPNQDRQTIFKPARLTGINGAWIDFRVMWRKHLLPDPKSRFHVYQIGQVHPLILGLKDGPVNKWIKLSDACKQKSMIADVYFVDGVQIHRTQVWYKVTPERDLILAIRVPEQNRIPVDLATQDVFIRLYSNAFYQTSRANSADDVIYVEGIQATSTQDILTIQGHVDTYKAKGTGAVTCWVNGFRMDKIDLVNSRVGDYLEFVYDGSVKRVVTFNVADLLQFTSSMDLLNKYLLHYPGVTDIIDYFDDLDLFFVAPSGTRFKGLYYHKNNPAAMRMLTHKDYSVPVSYLQAYMTAHPELGTLDNMQLIMFIRQSGYDRPLVDESSKIKDLYKLSDEDLLEAMIGVNSTVDVWKAPNLEASKYTELMSVDLGSISVDLVQQAYGYNAVSKLIGDTPQHTTLVSTKQRITLPTGLTDNSTVYEYDADGLLLGWYIHQGGGSLYTCTNDNARLCEVISGIASEGLQAFWDVPTHQIDPFTNYRFYTCDKVAGVINDVWTDVTGSSWYAIVNNQVTWLVDHNTKYTMVRPNSHHITYAMDYMAVDGVITYSLREWREDLQAYRTLSVPLGELDIWLNGRALIEGLDYFVDFPRVTIVNKEYLNNPDTQSQRIVQRFTNFCNSDLTRTLPADIGYVQWGTLSYNNKYDLRDDKVNRVIIGGALYRWDELQYGEDDFAIHVTDAKNGSPYTIRDIVVPMNDYLHSTDEKVDPTYTLRAQAIATDTAISNYMTLKIPEKVPTQPSAIPDLYRLVSPFFCRIVYDLISGALWDDKFTEQYSDQFVIETCQRYEYLLEWDPITDANFPDPKFTVIHPHNLNRYVDMGIYQFTFLSRVTKLYGSNRISLSSSIRVEQFGET